MGSRPKAASPERKLEAVKNGDSVPAYAGRYFTRSIRVGSSEIRLAEAPGKGSTGREVWRVAEHLACALENELEPQLLFGARVIELGCGCGLLGMTMAMLSGGKADIIVTDHDENALEMAQLNVELNNLSHCVKVQKLTWGSNVSSLVGEEGGFDFILGSDIIYHPHCLKQLQETMVDLSGVNTTVLLAHEHRQPALEQRFFTDCATKYGFRVDRVKRRYLDKREDSSLMSVYQLKKPVKGYANLRPQSAIIREVPQYQRARPSTAAPAGRSPTGVALGKGRPSTASGAPSAGRPSTASLVGGRSQPAGSYQRPYSARSAYTHDSPSLTRSSVGEVLAVSYKSINNSRALLSAASSREQSARTYG